MDKLMREKAVTIVLVFFVNLVAAKANIPALFAFGDSILDTGNNNNLLTVSKCNFPPYGRDFPGGKPTGRWGNGKVPTDLIAGALGIKQTVPAYLTPGLSIQDLLSGVSFASGGTGNDDTTANIQGVLSLSAQLRLFREYIGKVTAAVGQQRASNIISNSLYLFSSGNNDIAITYLPLKGLIPFPIYADLLVGWNINFVKSLYNLGARKIWVFSTLPLGCLPGARTVGGGLLRDCAPLVNLAAQIFNGKLSAAVNSLKATYSDYDIKFVDVYTPLLNVIQNPLSAGFINTGTGCCGTGTVETGVLCGILTPSCPNPSSYVFWDSGHPTQRAYEFVVASILKTYRLSNFVLSVNTTT
ncbi:hypothetical protein RJT34_25837 [Clitoria ternatea]|uniref:Uncharacterized protein n=1 Tax=Clitoria ternatea TaxID=43366 RepID=A0AAN9FWX9_CLITE